MSQEFKKEFKKIRINKIVLTERQYSKYWENKRNIFLYHNKGNEQNKTKIPLNSVNKKLRFTISLLVTYKLPVKFFRFLTLV